MFPVRDGSNWKYKADDLERFKADRDAGGSGWQKTDDLADLPLEANEHVESILLSEKELGESSESTSSTIIGTPGRKTPPDESDLQIATQADERGAESRRSDVSLAAGLSGTGSDVKLVLGGSDATKKKDPATMSDLDLRLEPTGSSKVIGGAAGGSGSGSELKLADPSGSSSKKKLKPGSDVKKPGSDVKKPVEAKQRAPSTILTISALRATTTCSAAKPAATSPAAHR